MTDLHAVRFRHLPAIALLAAALPVAGASLSVQVTDAAGKPLPGAVVYLDSPAAKAALKVTGAAEIVQANREFVPRVTVVPVGTSVSFPNQDTVRHHVYSFSPAKTFDIKLYAGTPAAPVQFDKAGVAVLGCNIHDQMVAWVVVLQTPYFARTGTDGLARLDGVPAGSYRLRGWHEALPPEQAPSDQALVLAEGVGTARVKVEVAP